MRHMCEHAHPAIQNVILKYFIYLFMRDTEREREREAETQAEGEAGSMQGAQRGTRSRVSRIMLWAEGSAKPLSHPGCRYNIINCIPHAAYYSTLYYLYWMFSPCLALSLSSSPLATTRLFSVSMSLFWFCLFLCSYFLGSTYK